MIGKRILEYDILRSLAVMWIVAVWHFANYFSTDSLFGGITNDDICRTITYVMLSLFMFLSGLFTNTRFEKKEDVKEYYLKKAKRFYPLYVLAALSLYITTIPHNISFYSSPTQLIMSMFGIATLLNRAPSTLWFMDMLLFLILITPMLAWKFNKKRGAILMLVIYALMYVAGRKMNMIDSRFVNYAPFYFMGLLLTPKGFLVFCQKYGIKCLLLALLILFVGKHHFLFDMVIYALFIIGGANYLRLFASL